MMYQNSLVALDLKLLENDMTLSLFDTELVQSTVEYDGFHYVLLSYHFIGNTVLGIIPI